MLKNVNEGLNSDIRSNRFFDTNIFGYSFVSFFLYKYIQIFVLIVFLYRNIFKYLFLSKFYIHHTLNQMPLFGGKLSHFIFVMASERWEGRCECVFTGTRRLQIINQGWALHQKSYTSTKNNRNNTNNLTPAQTMIETTPKILHQHHPQ